MSKALEKKTLYVFQDIIRNGGELLPFKEWFKTVECVFCQSPKVAKSAFSALGLSWKGKEFAEIKKTSLFTTLQEIFISHSIFLSFDTSFFLPPKPVKDLIYLAHSFNFEVIPLGAQSLILKLVVASGLGGNKFYFLGSFPNDVKEQIKLIKKAQFLSRETLVLISQSPAKVNQVFNLILNTLPEFFCVSVIQQSLNKNLPKVVTKTVEIFKTSPPTLLNNYTIFCIGTRAV